MMQRTELLSPAGSFEIFRAVLAAGADAVYAGAGRFSARAFADNFTEEQILRAIDEAHAAEKRFYLAVNTLVKDGELYDALSMTGRYYEAGLDAVIVQDLGLAYELHRQFPDLELHASTQLGVSGPYGMKLLEENGFSQAVLPRELKIDEIRQIRTQTDLKLECFVHGALCYCYSGKCLMSSMIGGRSANRGRCAQPCRLPYQTAGSGRKKKEIYPLSMKDLCAAGSLAQLVEAGVSSFKIEGRMKGAEYAAGVTAVYRSLLDRAEEGSGGICAQTRQNLEDLGSRSGFTNGYLEGKPGGRMISLSQPSHQKQTQSSFVREIRETYTTQVKKTPIRLFVRVHRNEALSLTLSLGTHSVTVEGEMVQAASSRPLDEETVRQKITKLGETPFTVSSCTVDLEEGCFCPVSALNHLRQAGCEALLADLKPRRAPVRVRMPQEAEAGRPSPEEAQLPLYVSAAEEAQLEEVLRESGAKVIIPDFDMTVRGKDVLRAAERIHEAGKKCFPAMPHTFRPETAARLRQFFAGTDLTQFDGFLLRCPDELSFFRDKALFPIMPLLMTDAGLYRWNGASDRFLRENGVQVLTAPYELSARELSGSGSVLTVYGRCPMMVSAQCVLRNTAGCSRQQENTHLTFLEDRKGRHFPVQRLCGSCENVIYNCVPTVLFSEAQRIRQMGFAGYRMDFLTETPAQIRDIFRQYEAFREGGRPAAFDAPFTYGAWRRGTE